MSNCADHGAARVLAGAYHLIAKGDTDRLRAQVSGSELAACGCWKLWPTVKFPKAHHREHCG